MRLTAHFFQMLPTLFRTQLTILLFGALFTIQAHSHGDTDDRVSIEPETQGLYNAGQIHFQFQLFDEQSSMLNKIKKNTLMNTLKQLQSTIATMVLLNMNCVKCYNNVVKIISFTHVDCSMYV
jgi:outer membrane protein assembly factor BamD (BamD/ComL family)